MLLLTALRLTAGWNNAFILPLGTVRPMQVDGIWEQDGLLYNPFVAELLSRKEYYVLRRNIRPDIVMVP